MGPRKLRQASAVTLVALCLGAAACSKTERPTGANAGRQATTTYSYSIVEGSPPGVLFRGRERTAELVLRNDGYLAWPRDSRFYYSPRWLGWTGDRVLEQGFRTPLPRDVAPGEEVRFSVRLKPPKRFGVYRVLWDLQSESSGWFAAFDRTPERPRWVLVLPHVEFLLAVVVPCAFLCLAVWLRRRFASAAAAAAIVGISDLVWAAASLWAKPYVLYGELATKFWPGPKPVTFAVVAFLLLPLTFLPARLRAFLAWGLAAFGALTVWTQLLYFRFFQDLASSVAAKMGGQTTALGSTVTSLAEGKDLWLLIDLVLAVPVLWHLTRSGAARLVRAPRWVPLVAAIVAIPFVWNGAGALASGQLHARRNLQNLRSVSQYGLFGFQLLDAANHVVGRFRAPQITTEDLEEVVRFFADTAPERKAVGPAAAAAAGLNLIGIQVESMQGFVVDLDVGGVPVTPNLRRLRREALDFTQVLDQTSRGRSSAGDFVTMTSLLPVGESIAYEYPDNDYFGLAHALGERGYSTLSAIPYKGSFWNRQVTHASYGFENSLFEESFERVGPRVGWGINDSDFFAQMMPVLDSLEEPFFAWLTTLSVHFPYESFPSGLERLDLGELEGTSLGNYLHGMSFFDAALGEFIDRLAESGLLERSVIAIWSDHASGLERDAHFNRYFGLRKPAQRFLFRRVPFVVRLPADRNLTGSHPLPAGQADIAPTLLALLGAEPDKIALMGRNLLGGSASSPVVHPQARWFDDELIHFSQFVDVDGGCWSAKELRLVARKRCARGIAAAERQLDTVTTVLTHDLQAEVTRRLRAQRSESASQ